MDIRAIKREEIKYTYRQSNQIAGQTGNIGRLRGDFGSNGEEFYTTWENYCKQWKTEEFRKELDTVINDLRSDACGLLTSRRNMVRFLEGFPEGSFEGNFCKEFGLRIDTEKYSYLFRCNPSEHDYNFYCFCYIKDWLNRHLELASKGIQFINPRYKELFRIEDGGVIQITDFRKDTVEKRCRYIDDYHVEVEGRIFHICEFAENMERIGSTVKPKEDN